MASILAIVEARTITGPAKNLIRFASANRDHFQFHFLTYARAATETEARSHTNLFIDTARKAGIPVSIVWEQGRFDRNVRFRLLRAIHEVRPEVVQTHSVKSHFMVARMRRRLGAPWIAFHHGYTAEDLKMRILNRFDRFSLPRAGIVVTVCQAFARDLQRYGVSRERLHVLHNSLDPAWGQRPALKDEGSALRTAWPVEAKNTPALLCVGRFSKEKGHGILLEAFERVARTRACFLVLIGEGPLKGDIEAAVRAKRLENRVLFAGQQKDVPPYFAAADMLVLPSLSEGSPNVLLEAMSAKLPIVSTRAGGACEIVFDQDTALVVPTNDAPALARAIERLASDEMLRTRLAERAHERLIQHFSPAAYDKSLSEIYRAALSPP